MANKIQIKRSYSTAAPVDGSLDAGELAYSFLSSSNSLFIGAIEGSIRIAGTKYTWLHQSNTVSPGALTANAVVITNGNSYVTEWKTNKLVVGADGTTVNVSTISTSANSTQLGGSAGGSNTELVTSYAVKTYIDGKTAALGGAVGNTQVVYSNGSSFVGSNAFAYDIATNTVSVGSGGTTRITLNGVNGNVYATGSLKTDSRVDILQGGTPMTLTNYMLIATANVNNYSQVSIQNKGAGDEANSSADFVAYPPGPHADDSTGFIDMGVTGNNYNQAAYSVTGGMEGYVFVSALSGSLGSGSLVLATDSTGTKNDIRVYVNGFSQAVGNTAMFISGANGNVSFGGNNAPAYKVFVNGTLGVNGASTFSANVLVNATLRANGQANVIGAATFSNTVSILGPTTISNTANVQGTFTAEHNVQLGTTGSDGIHIVGRVNTDVIPAHSGSENLGNSSFRWLGVYAQNGDFSGNVVVSGDLTVSGNVTTINTTNINIQDPLIRLANGNSTTDTVDVGIFGSFGNSTVTQYSGLFRDASAGGRYKLFAGNIPEPTTTVDTANVNFAYADLQVGSLFSANVQITGGSITGITDIVVADGGTGRSVFANNGILYGQNTSALAVTAAGTEGDVLKVGAGGVPTFGTLDGGTF